MSNLIYHTSSISAAKWAKDGAKGHGNRESLAKIGNFAKSKGGNVKSRGCRRGQNVKTSFLISFLFFCSLRKISFSFC